MKFSLLTKIIMGILTISPSIQASSDKYSCLKVDDIHGIYSRTERGNINLLNFVRDVSEKWSRSDRCEEVAKRFQRFYNNELLRFIGAGYVNNEPVLCAVVNEGELCNSENTLVTLPPQSDPVEEARRLMDTRGLAAGKVIEVNGKKGKLENFVDGRTYYDLEVLEQLILEAGNSDRLIEIE